MIKTFRKSQAAMEFLMTYGWAILVVLVAIGALAYFGVLSPERFLPSKCQLPAGIACTDFKIDSTANTVELVLRNGLGFDISDLELVIDGPTTVCDAATVASGGGPNDDCAAVAGCEPTGAGTCPLANGDSCTYTADCTANPISSGKFNSEIFVTYTNQESGLTHAVEGALIGQAE